MTVAPNASGSDRGGEDRLAAAAMRGDQDAVAVLWQRHRGWVAAVLLAHKPSFEDLEDLLQEVAMTLVAKVDTLRDHSNLRAWLRTVAVNTARGAGRAGKYRKHAPLEDDTIAQIGPGADDVAAEGMQDLLDRLHRLPLTYREPLLLRATKGLASKQIADILDIPPATVDTRIARARRMLRGEDPNPQW